MIDIYTDGSYMNTVNPDIVGWGFIINFGDGRIRDGKGIWRKWVDSHNITGECVAVIKALEYVAEDANFFDDDVCIYHDYEGIAKWVTGEWQTRKDLTKWYRNRFLSICDIWPLHYYFHHVKAHSGDRWNEMADELAKEAIYEHRI